MTESLNGATPPDSPRESGAAGTNRGPFLMLALLVAFAVGATVFWFTEPPPSSPALSAAGPDAEAESRIRVLEAQLDSNPQNAELRAEYLDRLETLGASFFKSKLFESALDAFKRQVDHDPENPVAPYNVGLTLQALRRPEEAQAAFEKALALDGAYLKPRQQLIERSLMKGDMETARRHCQSCLSQDPQNLPCLNNMGRIYSNLRVWPVAMKYYEDAREKAPENPFVLANLADVKLRLGLSREAIALYEQVIRIGFQPTSVLVNLGFAHSLERHHEKAKAIFDQVRQSLDDPPRNLLIFEAMNSIELGDLETARACLDSSGFEESGLSGFVQIVRGKLFLRSGETERALEAFKTLLSSTEPGTPENYEALLGLGDASVKASQPEEAIRYYKMAAANARPESAVQPKLARAFLGVGRHDEAVRYFDHALRFGYEPSAEETSEFEAARLKLTPMAIDTGVSFGFNDITAAAGIEFVHFMGYPILHLHQTIGPGVLVFDFDGDGFEDFFLANGVDLKKTPTLAPAGVSRTSKLYRNNGDRTFTEVSHAAGVDFTLPIISAAAPDLDRDGYPDLVITGVGVVESYLNLGDGGFRAWTGRIETHVPPDSVAASTSFGDLDLDGDLDGFVSVYSHMDREQLEARLLIMRVSNSNYPTPVTNNPLEDAGEFNILLMDQDGHMVDRTASMLPDGGRRRGRSFLSVMADLVDQGRPQILVSNDLSACNLYVQGQDGSYVDRAQDYWIADGRSNMGMAVADPDNDGDLDLFVTHWCRQLSGLFENLQPKPIFSDMALKVGIEKTDPEEVGWGANFVDLDLDGDLDLFVVNGHTQAARYDPETCFTTDKNLCVGQKPLVLISQDGRYKNRSDEVGLKDSTWIGRSTAAFDLDLDGDLDFIIGNNNTPAVLLETVQTAATEAGPSKNWISVELVGTQNNRQGIGARVTCSIPDDAAAPVRLREVVMGSSYLSQETLRSHFGLGRADHVTITVRWPGGQTQVIEHVRTNQILRVVEAS